MAKLPAAAKSTTPIDVAALEKEFGAPFPKRFKDFLATELPGLVGNQKIRGLIDFNADEHTVLKIHSPSFALFEMHRVSRKVHPTWFPLGTAPKTSMRPLLALDLSRPECPMGQFIPASVEKPDGYFRVQARSLDELLTMINDPRRAPNEAKARSIYEEAQALDVAGKHEEALKKLAPLFETFVPQQYTSEWRFLREAYAVAGEAMMSLGRVEEALATWLEHDHCDSCALDYLSYFDDTKLDPDRVIEYGARMLERKPYSVSGYLSLFIYLGRAYIRKGDAASARKTFTEFNEYEPNDERRKEAVERLEVLAKELPARAALAREMATLVAG